MSKGKDISTMYTKQCNAVEGRRGYCGWKREKENSISPKDYGEFLSRKRK